MSDTDGWIEHDGKGMPVDGKTIVSVRHSDGGISRPCAASEWGGPDDKRCYWSGKASHPSDNIVAYKVVS